MGLAMGHMWLRSDRSTVEDCGCVIVIATAHIVELSEKGKHLTRNFWPARGICIEGSETVCVFSVNFHNSEFS